MITLNIDVTRLDKMRFKEVKRRDGSTAKFCELVLIDHEDDRGNHFIVKQSVTKQEREEKKQMPILGNGKDWSRGREQNSRPKRDESTKPAPAAAADPDDTDVPF